MKKIFLLILLAPLAVSAQSDPEGIPRGVDILKVMEKIINLIAQIGVGLGILFLIVAAIKFITAQGDENKIKEARVMILWVLIGVAVVLSSQALVNYITNIIKTS